MQRGKGGSAFVRRNNLHWCAGKFFENAFHSGPVHTQGGGVYSHFLKHFTKKKKLCPHAIPFIKDVCPPCGRRGHSWTLEAGICPEGLGQFYRTCGIMERWSEIWWTGHHPVWGGCGRWTCHYCPIVADCVSTCRTCVCLEAWTEVTSDMCNCFLSYFVSFVNVFFLFLVLKVDVQNKNNSSQISCKLVFPQVLVERLELKEKHERWKHTGLIFSSFSVGQQRLWFVRHFGPV